MKNKVLSQSQEFDDSYYLCVCIITLSKHRAPLWLNLKNRGWFVALVWELQTKWLKHCHERKQCFSSPFFNQDFDSRVSFVPLWVKLLRLKTQWPIQILYFKVNAHMKFNMDVFFFIWFNFRWFKTVYNLGFTVCEFNFV